MHHERRMKIPSIPDRPSKRYFQLALAIAILSFLSRACDFLETHELPILRPYIQRVKGMDIEARTSTMSEWRP